MGDSRGGHHGDVVYKFEDGGFRADPTDTEFKVFGGNATLDTFEGSHEAVRVFNAGRRAAEIITQVFDGAWSVSCELGTEPPWWLAGVFGQPDSNEVTTGYWEHDYALDVGGDIQTLQLYTPTDGFAEYEILRGCAIASVTIDQTHPNNPEVSITGAYATHPERDSSETITIPQFSKSTFSNRMADLEVDGDRVAKSQTQQVEIQTGTELVGEIGSDDMVDFIPRAFEPSVTHDKIIAEGQTVDPLQRFLDASQVTLAQEYNNGESGDAEYFVSIDVTDGLPNSWSQSGRNDPDADLTEELQEMGEDATATIGVDMDVPS